MRHGMRGGWLRLGRVLAAAALAAPGCVHYLPTPDASLGIDHAHYAHLARQIEYPAEPSPSDDLIAATPRPLSLSVDEPQDYLDLSLEETIHLALANSKVMRDLGGLVLRSPDNIRTRQDPAVAESDPRFGVEAALSAYDATFTSSYSYENNDRALNNVFFGGGTRLLTQNFMVNQTQLAKTGATGTQFALKNYTQYDANNAPGNFVPSAWTTWFDLEGRHPILQGGGVNFNRLAGPNAQPGLINGVVIARINSDSALADFEASVRTFVSDVENTYWDLYFAYRDLDAKLAARNAALETWQRVHALYDQGRRGGEAEKEAQAREQYYRFQEEAQNALHGRLIDGTRTNNGSTGGTFRGSGGVYVVERRMRLLIGLPISDGRLIRPSEEPLHAELIFDWEISLVEALTRRVELRRQKWQIKKREAELEANKNFLMPQLDAVARYRWRGFGDDLFPAGSEIDGRFNNAVADLVSGDFQEWQVGFEFSLPIGFRQAFAAVRNSELLLARERSLLLEQERAVVYDLSNAIADLERARQIVETNLNRRLAAREQLQAVQAAFDADNATLDLLLEGQRRVAEADVAYYRSLVEYTLAAKNVQLEKGTLLDYNEVYLQEGPWPDKAYEDAELKEWLRGPPVHRRDAPKTPAPTVSYGVYPQSLAPSVQTFEGDYATPATLPEDSAPPPVPAVE
ncbi:MAG: TolC family protein [Planctomycetaceae bacterium]|nr:TolC family protein [Planctomycetaceae bacterium]